ncbi:hypothetical protein A3I46_02685 [Candidatus Kaiserbacteria bacterium RIFCSPLOWO2_02_FULL_54_13]|uniref:Rod shape-determining protein MreD n=1 Tax=Candidatus Kaiserbacteria bacterium RIFCSPHIGHO2_02_FULL_54_22 TaxID=1798495 RepID=A0A1F6DLP3_9BACT|nr:MAG: hypothetical protein A3C19_03520 [Candidatus Kaiserbacteria bacterium RIFCSPHIGHO2_02_FULL_54_22]OGG68847.1 MAG: hypothetical protein A3E99_02930 [Candidatus Kaiserbacteria bacterium RIFCSPHIGHO2_12_FULL_54_16]OGG83852.1 MAG: hypothetical protein A3I46_02685 [Candidatus Kaiserbacteria bacterium RIFCSPLOWO2_02_FULL_54_13]OGG90157.1 MAG: hypothetical protein A3G12_03230 [Candidatus Kaiserbacteria bacterium RIFCSPLOWO2_12_FULL_54_10]
MKFSSSSGWLKFIIGWSVVFLFRLIPLRLPNVEPMLATMMPFSKRYGPLGSFVFGFFGIVLYDAVTSGWGIWTLVTALAYGGLGLAAYFYFKNRSASVKNFLRFGIVGTIVYDALTGLTIGPLFMGQPFVLALTGQIPFTLLHLAGTAVFSVCLSPAIYRWVLRPEALEIPAIIHSWHRTSS